MQLLEVIREVSEQLTDTEEDEIVEEAEETIKELPESLQ